MKHLARGITILVQSVIIFLGLWFSLLSCLDGSGLGLVRFAGFIAWATCLALFLRSKSAKGLIGCRVSAIALLAYFGWIVLTGRDPAGKVLSTAPGEMSGLVILVTFPCFVVVLLMTVGLHKLWDAHREK